MICFTTTILLGLLLGGAPIALGADHDLASYHISGRSGTHEVAVGRDSPPAFLHIGYYEAESMHRSCLRMKPTDIPPNTYSHVHFAFASITGAFGISIDPVKEQFEQFQALEGVKRIISVGAWVVPRGSPPYPAFSSNVTANNRAALTMSIFEFVEQNNLDGVELHWEHYVLAGINGTSSAIFETGTQYVAFLKTLRTLLPNGKSISVVISPAYLFVRGLPIKEIGDVVDHIVFKAYDLHGQWDSGDPHAIPDCPEGNCLRSHVNKTETDAALKKILTAGVPANKVIVAVSSFGRTVQLTHNDCFNEGCSFESTPNRLAVIPGRRTHTSGYLAAAEIREILTLGQRAEAEDDYDISLNEYIYDEASDTDIVVYNGDQWISWMSEDTKTGRIEWIKSLQLGGVADWALDLQRDFWGDTFMADGNYTGRIPLPDTMTCVFDRDYDTLDDLAKDSDKMDTAYKTYHVIDVLVKLLNTTMEKFDTVKQDYDSKFQAYAKSIKSLAPEQLKEFIGSPDGIGDGPANPFMTCDVVGTVNYHGTCPVPSSILQPFKGVWNLTYTINDHDGYFKALNDKYGLDESMIEFGE